MYDEGKDEFYIAGNHGKEFDDAFWEKALRSLCDAGCAKLLFSGFGFLSRVLNGRYSDVMPSSVSHVRPMIRVMRFTKLCWVGDHVDIIMKPTNSPTQGQPNPRKYEVKGGLWATFSRQQTVFRGFEIDVI